MAADKAKVAIFEARPLEEEYLRTHLPDLDLHFFPGPLDTQTVAEADGASIVSVFIRSRLTPDVIARLPNLRLITTRSTGFDHIDLNAAKARGIIVCNVPGYGENAVAEFAFGLMLCVSRKIIQANQRAREGKASLQGLEGFDLKGKVLGVIGAGHIGLHAIRIGRGFGMDVLAHDMRPQPLLAEVLGFTYLPFEDVLRRADIVSLHAPETPRTYHMMNRDRFAMMKRGSVLINTARGSLVDSTALLWALNEGILSGAGLDVVEGEELVSEEQHLLVAPGTPQKVASTTCYEALVHHENVVVTPHVAFNSREALLRILETTVTNIECFLAGQPVNVVSGAKTA